MAVKVRWGTDSPRRRRTTWKTSSPSLTRSSFHDHLINISFVWYFEKCTLWSEIVYFEEKAELFTRKPSYQCQGVVRSWQRSYDMIRWHENTQCLHCMIVKVTDGWLLGFKAQDIYAFIIHVYFLKKLNGIESMRDICTHVTDMDIEMPLVFSMKDTSPDIYRSKSTFTKMTWKLAHHGLRDKWT